MKAFLIFLFALPAFADICICQYPKEDAEYGEGYKAEVLFYKMGCGLWLLKETKCRKEKIININNPVEPYLDKHLKPNEKIRMGYVGHWSSSNEYVRFLKDKIQPLLPTYKVPIEYENTACSAMSNPVLVQDYLKTIPSDESVYLSVEGAQTTSIGMWDKILIGKGKADLVAYGDSRGGKSIYPSCKTFLKKRCTAFQVEEQGKCVDENNQERDLICHRAIKEKKNGSLKLKKAKRWLYLEEISVLSQRLVSQAVR